MKTSKIARIAFTIFFLFFAGIIYLDAQSVVTFRVDMSGEKLEAGTVIGIRGNVAPLYWDRTLPMDDADGDGIYSAQVIFNDGKPGDRIMYKYMKGDTWDMDRFAMMGNRVVTLCNCTQELPVDKWDILEGFAYELMLQDASDTEFTDWVYIIGNGKKRGLSPEETTQEFMNFWGWNFTWIEKPQFLMYMEQFNQSKYQNGYFEEIENTTTKVVFRMRQVWPGFIRSRGEGGVWMGVTEADMTAVIKTWYEIVAKNKEWSFDWKDEGKDAVVTLEVKR